MRAKVLGGTQYFCKRTQMSAQFLRITIMLLRENAKALKYHLFILYQVYFDCPHSALFCECIAYFEGMNYSSHKALQMTNLMQTIYIFKLLMSTNLLNFSDFSFHVNSDASVGSDPSSALCNR